MGVSPKRIGVVAGLLGGVLVLYVLGSEERENGGEPTSGNVGCRVTVTADVLNVRAGPSTDAKVVRKVEQGMEIDAEPVVTDGFRKLGKNRWVSEDFVTVIDGHDCG